MSNPNPLPVTTSGKTLKPYLPKKIMLPHGYKITVQSVLAKKMVELHGEDYDGIWDSDSRIIYIKKFLDKQRRWYIFAHEFEHAVNDWFHWLVNEGIAKG